MRGVFNKFLLMFFIFADVVSDNSLFKFFTTQSKLIGTLLLILMQLFQIVGAPIQAAFSDAYRRKKTLFWSLFISFFSFFILLIAKSLGVFLIGFLFIATFLKGSAGNNTPLVWSTLTDAQEKNLRFNLALLTGSYAFGYMLLAFLNKTAIKNPISSFWLLSDVASTVLFFISAGLCMFYICDREDGNKKVQEKSLSSIGTICFECRALWKDFMRSATRWGLAAYFFWATSQYSVLILLTDIQIKYASTVLWMMFGYLVGIAMLWVFRKFEDEKVIRIAFVVTISALSLYFIIIPFISNKDLTLSICYFFYTLSNAFLSPTIFSLFSKEREIHEQGKGFGLIVAADSAGFLVGGAIGSVLSSNLNHVIWFSFCIFLVSLYPYLLYEKKRKDNLRIKELNK
jgi:predicted MFS family arabinose efflux permease